MAGVRRRRTALLGLAVALLALAAACGSSGDEVGRAAGSVEPERELVGVTGWLNSEPFTIADQIAQERAVLVDFWTYTCINCIRTLPFLREWHKKYAEHGLVILGVHSPEFDFEHDRANVAAAIADLDVRWPVAQDNDFATWRAFKNNAWPTKYLIGVDGEVVYEHVGEGEYADTELAIREALTAAGRDVSAIAVGSVEPELDPVAERQTRELYGGYQRNYNARGLYAAQEEYYVAADQEVEYEDIDTSISERKHHQWYVQGLWRNEREAIVHARTTTQLEDYLALRFISRSVNVVLSPPPGDPFTVVVELDGRSLLPVEAGPDISFDGAGRSVIVVDSARVYAIVELPEWGDHDLKLRSDSASFAVFAFTFGSYLEGA